MGTRLIGLGNAILRDDAVGLHVVREAARRLPPDADVEVLELEVGGFALMEAMTGCHAVVLVDATELPGVPPGTVQRIGLDELGLSLRLASPHEVDLAGALAVGRELGYAMPEQVVIIGVQGEELRTFGEELSAVVAAAVPAAVARVLEELERLSR